MAAGLAAGVALVILFAYWAANPPVYRAESWSVFEVVLPEGASLDGEGKSFEPQHVSIKSGDGVRWVNQEKLFVTIVVEPACESADIDAKAISSPTGTEKELGAGDSLECRFFEPGQYRVHTEPWPWMQGTVTVEP